MDYDHLSVSNGSGDAATMTITADRLAGDTTIHVSTIVNVPTRFFGTWGTLGSNGLITSASKRDFRGHLSGSNVIIDGMEPGNTDSGNTANQVIVIKPNTGWSNRVASFIKNTTGAGDAEPALYADAFYVDDLHVNTNLYIPDNSIVPAKLTKVWYEELARTTLSVAGNSLAATFTPRKYLRVLIAAKANLPGNGAGIEQCLQFNNDGGNNYGYTYAYIDPGTVSWRLGQNINQPNITMDLSPISEDRMQSVIDISQNIAGSPGKTVIANNHYTGPFPGQFSIPFQVWAHWAGTAQINSIQWNNTSGSANSFAPGSELIVLGHD